MTATLTPTTEAATTARPTRRPVKRIVLHVFLCIVALSWLFPLGWAVLNSFRDYAYTAIHGYVSFGGFTLQNYVNAWTPGRLRPALLELRGDHRARRGTHAVPGLLHGVRTGALQFPVQPDVARGVPRRQPAAASKHCLVPVYRMFRAIQLPAWLSSSGTLLNNQLGVILINVAFQLGFCTFVLSNYMKTIPAEIYESARVDGASVTRQFFQLTLPLCRPPLAALATLQVTWIYNEFFWATVLLQSGDKFPITSSLNSLQGQFFTDYNLLSAGSVLAMLPVLIIFFALQRQFVSGLTLGSTKG